jgi:mono/diheme cytochrome c family protein
MPRPILYVLLVLVALSLIPVGLMYKSRHSGKAGTRVQVVYDMDSQAYAKAQTTSEFFADGMSMRKHPEGTVARGLLHEDKTFFRGISRDTFFTDAFPLPVTVPLLDRGQERFNIYCAPCHGQSGNGQGMVHKRAISLAEGTWTPPTDLTSQAVIDRPVGHIYNTIANGIRTMPAYGPQIDPEDRWAITAYVRALQLSRNASLADVPADQRAALEAAAASSQNPTQNQGE